MAVRPIEVPLQIRTRVGERVIEQDTVTYSKNLANGRPGEDFLLPFLNLTVSALHVSLGESKECSRAARLFTCLSLHPVKTPEVVCADLGITSTPIPLSLPKDREK